MTHKANRVKIFTTGQIIQLIIALIIASIVLVPLGTSVMGGLKKNSELLLSPTSIPKAPKIENYTGIMTNPMFWRMLANSLLVMAATTFGVVSLAGMAAYVFARIPFKGREIVYIFFTLGLLFPAAVAILPLYLTARDAGLVDTYWGLILPQVAFGLPLAIIVLRGFFAQVPLEIEEAAMIDGASRIRIFFAVVVPIMRPALAAVGVLVMVSSWNAFFWPLLVLNSETLYTLPLGVMQFSTQYSTDYGKVLAFVSLAMVPAIVFYFFAERQIVSGLTGGALKG